MDMLRRFPLILLLALEGVVAGALVAMLGGFIPAGEAGPQWVGGMLIWVAGVSLVLAGAITIVFPEAAKRVARHGALAIGAVFFMLPFLWLVGTSFKQPEETLAFPPRWLPDFAAAPDVSPWADEQGEHAVRLGELSVRDLESREEPVSADWEAVSPAAGREGDVFSFDFARGGVATIRAEVDLPIDASEFILRMRQDNSWHAVSATIETGGRRYETDDALYLGSDGWREWTFRLPGIERRDQRAMGVWPLTDAGPSDIDPGGARLTVSIHEKSRFGATVARWTQSYRDAWYADEHWGAYLFNSVWIVVLSVVGQVLSCSMAAYAFARLRWPGREVVFGLVLATMMLPTMVVMVPQFLIFKSLGWYNTLLPLWAPAFVGTPFFIFLLRQFMLGVPRELEEAARIDGCSWWGIYWRIMLPLMKPALAAVAIFTFMNAWNEFMAPLIYLNDQRLYPLPLGLFVFRGAHQFQANFNMLMAASTLMTLPVIAIFFLAQRYFIEGVTLTGMKG